MIMLGLSCSTICLLKEEEIIAGAQEEQFNREKRSPA
jgi:predicted NodU family carbamoyl transferase